MDELYSTELWFTTLHFIKLHYGTEIYAMVYSTKLCYTNFTMQFVKKITKLNLKQIVFFLWHVSHDRVLNITAMLSGFRGSSGKTDKGGFRDGRRISIVSRQSIAGMRGFIQYLHLCQNDKCFHLNIWFFYLGGWKHL